jgi:SAM-dependent methyltransferase
VRDISEYYVGDLAVAEESAWNESKEYLRNVTFVQDALDWFWVSSVVEVGCGSGLIPTQLHESVKYLGIDRNDVFLGWARDKNNPTRTFVNRDVRQVSPEWLKQHHGDFAVSTCFAFLKHFGLHEFDDLLVGLMRLAPYSVFEVQQFDSDVDTGTDFHHVFVTEERLNRCVRKAGHRILSQAEVWRGSIPDGEAHVLVVTTGAITPKEKADEDDEADVR